MNESTNRVAADESQQPQNYENYKDGPQHPALLLSVDGVRPRMSSDVRTDQKTAAQ